MRTQKNDIGTDVEYSEEVCGGDACIRRTRIPVWTLEQCRRLGFSEEELLEAYPSLDRHDLATARDYVSSHQAEIDQAIRDNEELMPPSCLVNRGGETRGNETADMTLTGR